MALDEEQIRAFRTDGYLNVGPLFARDALETIGKEYDRLVTFDAQVLGSEEDGVFPYRAMLNFRSPELKRCILHPPLLEIAVQILGPDVRFWWDQGINKAPGAGSVIAWHQDNGYQEGRTQEYLTCWLALDDSSLENGGLLVVPGSQEEGLRKHEWQGVHAVIPDGESLADHAIALDAQAGEILIFSSHLVHQTVGNKTLDKNRRAWVIQYCRADQHNEVTGEVYDNRPWAVRGGETVRDLWSERPFELKRNHA